jgi:putative ABC transport system permease protein
MSRRKRMLEQLDEDIREHLERGTQDLIDRGMSPKDARYAALRKFGNVARIKEQTNEVWSIAWLEQFLQDLRYGARTLRRNVGFTIVAILALTIGIGVNTTAFTFYKAMFTRSLDARDPGRMVDLSLVHKSGDNDYDFSYPDFKAYQENLHSFSGVIAHNVDRLTLTGVSGPTRKPGVSSILGTLGLLPADAINAEFAITFEVSENYFSVLGVHALRGRTFDALSAAELAASPSVLISENYWQKRFAGDPAILGKVVRLNGPNGSPTL